MKFTTVKKKDLVFNDMMEVDVAEDRTFSGVAYSGKPILNHPFWGNLAFEVSTMKAKNTIPLLFNHNMDRIVGSCSPTFTDKVEVKGNISSVTPDGITSFKLIKEEKFPMQESVYIEPEFIQPLQKGEKLIVNGHEIEGPGHIFKGGTIKEVSLTPLGADSETSTTIFNNQNLEIKIAIEEKPMNEEMKKFAELYAKSPEEAFKFACSCQEKTSKDDGDAKDKKIEELQAALDKANEKIDELNKNQKEKASLERKDKLKKVFGDLGVTLNADLEEAYLAMSEDKFSKVLSGLEADAKKAADEKAKKFGNITGYESPAGGTSTGGKVDKEKEDKIFALARKIRTESPSQMGVADSLQKAREQIEAAEQPAA